MKEHPYCDALTILSKIRSFAYCFYILDTEKFGLKYCVLNIMQIEPSDVDQHIPDSLHSGPFVC